MLVDCGLGQAGQVLNLFFLFKDYRFVNSVFNVFTEGPIVTPKENVATAGWFIGMMLAIAFLLLVLIIVCIIKRNRGGKYVVHERETAYGRHNYPEEPGFHEYSQPYVFKIYIIWKKVHLIQCQCVT